MVKKKNLTLQLQLLKLTPFLYTYYKQFPHLYIDPNSHLIQYYTPNSRTLERNFPKNQPFINQTCICLSLSLAYAAFDKFHSHGHSWEKLSNRTFNQYYYIPHLPLWFSILIQDCIDCQTDKHFLIKPNKISPPLPFYESAIHFITKPPWTHNDLLLLLNKTNPIFCHNRRF